MISKYENPAKLYLEGHSVKSLADVIAFTDFLRTESGVSSNPPINLQAIINRFGLPDPMTVNLPQQQGMIIPHSEPFQIIIHDGDIASRQRFSLAHELIELLFLELPGEIRPDRLKENIFGTKKERICQAGAANLLMPRESFHPRAMRMGLSFQSAELLADEFEVSLMAALCRLIDMYPKQGVMILWQLRNKPTELKKEVPDNQLELPGFHPTNLPAPKLRVAWSYGNFKDLFIPEHKSIPDDSSVYEAWKTNRFASGEEKIPFGGLATKAIIESNPFSIDGEKQILSLIR